MSGPVILCIDITEPRPNIESSMRDRVLSVNCNRRSAYIERPALAETLLVHGCLPA